MHKVRGDGEKVHKERDAYAGLDTSVFKSSGLTVRDRSAANCRICARCGSRVRSVPRRTANSNFSEQGDKELSERWRAYRCLCILFIIQFIDGHHVTS
jgi:hypothetical protein